MRRILNLVVLCCLMAFAGCGGGNDGAGGLNGAVTVAGSQTASNYSSNVTFTITYTNPLVTNLIGVPVNYTVTVDGVAIDHQATNFNNSGILTVTYNVPKDVAERSVRCVANSANLIGSDTEIVAAFGALSVTPSTISFTEAAPITKTYTISGGSGSFTATSSNPTLISVSVSGTTVNATRLLNTGDPNVLITVTDTITGDSVQVQAVVTAVP